MVPIEAGEKRPGAPHSAHALEADGSSMSGAQQVEATTADGFRLTGAAAPGLRDRDTDTAAFEFKVFDVVIVALALCILTVTVLYFITVCYSRSRQSKRAHVYESAVTRGEPAAPVAVRGVKRSTSFINPLACFRKPEAAKDNSRIYYIYSNPLPVGLREEEEEEWVGKEAPRRPAGQTAGRLPRSFQEYANDPDSGVTLEPPIFYMQL